MRVDGAKSTLAEAGRCGAAHVCRDFDMHLGAITRQHLAVQHLGDLLDAISAG